MIELLVVVAIIALLVSILVPSVQQARELAERVVCAANIRSICLAMNMYAQENDNTLPAIRLASYDAGQAGLGYFGLMGNLDSPWYPQRQPWWMIVNPYVGDTREVFRCPTDTGPLPELPESGAFATNVSWYEGSGTSYVFNAGPLDVFSPGPRAEGPPRMIYSLAGGCWARKIASIPNPSKLVLAADWTLWWTGYQAAPDVWWDFAYYLTHDPVKPLLNLGFVDGHVDFAELQESPDHFNNSVYDLAQK